MANYAYIVTTCWLELDRYDNFVPLIIHASYDFADCHHLCQTFMHSSL